MNGPHQTGDVYKCSINRRNNGCSKLNLGTVPQHTAQNTTYTTHPGIGNQDVRLSVNTMVSHVGDRPVGTIPVIPLFFFFFFNGLCTFPRVCYTTHLTTGFFIGKNVSRRLDWHMKFCGVNIWIQDVDAASATHTAITCNVPDGGTSVRALKNKLYFSLSKAVRPASSL